MIPRNPYIAGSPVDDETSFIGYADVLRAVLRVLRSPSENAIALYGQRRIGKTSVLMQLMRQLPREGPYHPVYYDLQDKAGWPLGHLLEDLAGVIAEALARPVPDLGSEPELAFRQQWILSILDELPESHVLVLLLDEFDVLDDPRAEQASAAFFPYLHNLLTSNPARLKSVFVIGRNIADLSSSALSLFKDIPSYRISLLGQADTIDLVRLSDNNHTLVWSDDAINRVWQLTHGHRYLTQCLCAQIWEQAYDRSPNTPPTVTPSDVDAAVPETLMAGEHALKWLWGGLPPAARVVASILAEPGPGPVSQKELERLLRDNSIRVIVRELLNAPQLLRDWDVIEPADGGYRFRVELIRRWIADRKPPQHVWEEIDRIDPVAENLYLAAVQFYRTGQFGKAIGPLQQAIELNPYHVRATLLLADILLAQGQSDKARDLLERLYEYDPQAAHGRLTQALLSLAQAARSDDEQLALYDRVLELDPAQPDAIAGRQRIQQQREAYKAEPAGDVLGQAGTIAAGDIAQAITESGLAEREKINSNLQSIRQNALSAAEEGRPAHNLTLQLLAESVGALAQALQTAAESFGTESIPYTGLRPYSLQDAWIFFGREQAIHALIAHLERSPLTVLHAESGAGKTSLLSAGIMPRLLANGHLPLYVCLSMTPVPLAIKRSILPDLEQTPRLAAASLHDFLHQVTELLGGKQLVVILDQFEEVLNGQTIEVRNDFASELGICLDDASLPVRWILAVRAEQLSELASLRPQVRELFANEYRLSNLTPSEALEVLIEPAKQRGVAYEPGLAERLIADLDQPGISPPLLQLVCWVLFNSLRDQLQITYEMYEMLGGASGILRNYLGLVLNRAVLRNQREVARRLLIAIATSRKNHALCTRDELIVEMAKQGVNEATAHTLLEQLIQGSLLYARVSDDGKLGYDLWSDYLVETMELDLKNVQELLRQEVNNYRRYNTLVSAERLVIIEANRSELIVDQEAEVLLDQSIAALRIEDVAVLGQQADPEALALLLRVLGQDAPPSGLRQLSPGSQRRERAEMRKAVAEALGNIGDLRAVEPLIAQLQDPEQGPRLAAVQALGQIGDGRATAALNKALDDRDAQVREATRFALNQISSGAMAVGDGTNIKTGSIRGDHVKTAFPLDTSPEEQLIAALQERNLALCIGAGISAQVTGLPSSADLARELAGRYGLDEALSLAEVAQQVGQAGNRWAFTTFLRDALDMTGQSPSSFHQRLVALVVQHHVETIITTNYDNLLELAFQQAGVRLNRVVRGGDVAFIDPQRPTLIKLYGEVEQPETLIVTDRDQSDLLRDRGKKALLDEVRQALRRKTLLFLGYNLADFDFRFLFDQVAGSHFARLAYIVSPGLPETEVRMWRERGIIPLDVEPLTLINILAQATTAPNPFYERGRITDPSRFFDRQDVVQDLIQRLHRRENISLIGERGMGKSSLLAYLHATRERWMPDHADRVIYLDCQGLTDRRNFYAKLTEALGGKGDNASAFMDAIEQGLAILLLDEFERLVDMEGANEIFNVLRSVFQQGQASSIIVTQGTLSDLVSVKMDLSVSPLSNIYSICRLGPYSVAVAREFLTTRLEGTGVTFSEEEIDRLVEESGGHSGRLTELASDLYSEKTGVAPQSVPPETKPSEPISPSLKEIQARLSPSSRDALMWAEGLRQATRAEQIYTEYLLAGLAQKTSGPTHQLLTLFDDDATLLPRLVELINEMTATSVELDDVRPAPSDALAILKLSASAEKTLTEAAALADKMGSSSIRSRHLLAGILAVPESWAAKWVVDTLQVECETLYRLIVETPDMAPPLERIRQASARRQPTVDRQAALRRIRLTQADLFDLRADIWFKSTSVRLGLSTPMGRRLREQLGPDFDKRLKALAPVKLGQAAILDIEGLPARYLALAPTVDLDSSMAYPTADSASQAVLAALREAEKLPDVRTLVITSVGTSWGERFPVEIAPRLMQTVVEYLEHGSRLEQITFSNPEPGLHLAYETAYQSLGGVIETQPEVIAHPWYLGLDGALPAELAVGQPFNLTFSLRDHEQPGSILIPVPESALELTFYIEAPSFHLEGPHKRILRTVDGELQEFDLNVHLVPLISGEQTVRLLAYPGGRIAGLKPVPFTIPVRVVPPLALPNIPELIDRRMIPDPQPDVMLYVALEEMHQEQQVRMHITCPALSLDREPLNPLSLTEQDLEGIRRSATQAAVEANNAAPPDVLASLNAFGAALFNQLMPPGHPMRDIYWRITRLADPSWSWLIVSDERAVLPWEMVCAYALTPDTGELWYDDFLGHKFVLGHWVGRQGLLLAAEAPLGRIDLAHYQQHPQELPRWMASLGGAEEVGIEDRAGHLALMQSDSPYYGLHIVRYNDRRQPGRITAASDGRPDVREIKGEATAMLYDQRLDFTLRRPVVGLSFLESEIEDVGMGLAERDTRLEWGWMLPFMHAGASALVGPRWHVSPEADQLFFHTFYRVIRSGETLGCAVQQARELVRLTFPHRADWLAYAHYGSPECEPYLVRPSRGFVLIEAIDQPEDAPFLKGKTYRFRASYRAEAPVWYDGRLHIQTEPLEGEDVSVLIAPVMSGVEPQTHRLKPVLPGSDYQYTVEIRMPDKETTLPILIRFQKGKKELRSLMLNLDVK
jgi:tetratricopeptide (TPR) repeat protein/O-acetyl-ADP-ribose deacetylase (regulator of RNase III)